jgi:ribonuclease HII
MMPFILDETGRYKIYGGIIVSRTYTIAEVSEFFSKEEISEEMLAELRQDSRKGVQKLIGKFDREQMKRIQLQQQYEEMLAYENEQYDNGKRWIAGIDEAGRGPLAGPVVAACVILNKDFYLPGLNDSKQLTEKVRDQYYDEIKKNAVCCGVGIVKNEEVDVINIYQSTKKAMKQAFFSLTTSPDHLLIDAVRLDGMPCTSHAITKGDQKSVTIAAASVIAKVTRDRIMKEIHEEYPMYDFKTNMGYGTKKHLEAIEEYGITPYHRKTFSPVQNVFVR